MANDYFRFKQFTIRQDLCAMKVGTDGTLLGAWARPPASGRGLRLLDIGTGTGLIALMLAQRYPQATVLGIDIDPSAVRQARLNVASSPFAARVRIVEGDIADFASRPQASDPVGLVVKSNQPAPARSNGSALSEGSFDAVVSNPPYFVDSLQCPDGQRTLARHTASLSYASLCRAAYRLLTADGLFSVVIPFDCRERLVAEACLAGFSLSRLCAVKTTPRKSPKRYLIEFSKSPVAYRDTSHNSPESSRQNCHTSESSNHIPESSSFAPDSSELILESSPNVRTPEYRALTADFYL